MGCQGRHRERSGDTEQSGCTLLAMMEWQTVFLWRGKLNKILMMICHHHILLKLTGVIIETEIVCNCYTYQTVYSMIHVRRLGMIFAVMNITAT